MWRCHLCQTCLSGSLYSVAEHKSCSLTRIFDLFLAASFGWHFNWIVLSFNYFNFTFSGSIIIKLYFAGVCVWTSTWAKRHLLSTTRKSSGTGPAVDEDDLMAALLPRFIWRTIYSSAIPVFNVGIATNLDLFALRVV